MQPLLIDELQAAEMLGLSAKTLYNLRRAGQIPFVRVQATGTVDDQDSSPEPLQADSLDGDSEPRRERGRILYRVSALEKWAEQREQVATV